MFTGEFNDTGTHNSFVDAFHRSWNNLNGDLWRSQADATVTNHIFTGIGLGNRSRPPRRVPDRRTRLTRQLPKRLAVGSRRRIKRHSTLGAE